MASAKSDATKIWDDESGEPSPMTAAEFDARLEAANQRRVKEIEEAEARNRELLELTAQKEMVLARLQAALDEAKREAEGINQRVAALNIASRRARKRHSAARLSAVPSSHTS